MTAVALAAAVVFFGIAAMHLYWAAGGRVGAAAAVPERSGRPVFTPRPPATVAAGLAFALAGGIVLARASVWELPVVFDRLVGVATWAIGLIFLLRAIGDFRLVGFFKRVRGTRFATLDTRAYSPLALAVAVAVLWLAAQ
jgi:hypothetical protein